MSRTNRVIYGGRCNVAASAAGNFSGFEVEAPANIELILHALIAQTNVPVRAEVLDASAITVSVNPVVVTCRFGYDAPQATVNHGHSVAAAGAGAFPIVPVSAAIPATFLWPVAEVPLVVPPGRFLVVRRFTADVALDVGFLIEERWAG